MDHTTPESWLAAQPLFPYRSRESLVKAAWNHATQVERAACAAIAMKNYEGPDAAYEIEEQDGK